MASPPESPDHPRALTGPASTSGAWWVAPHGDQQGIARYADILRAGKWIIAATLALCVGAAVLYLSQATKVYEASADILVSPQGDLPVPVPGVIQESSDPTRDVETAARLVTSPSVARRVRRELRLDVSTEALGRKVKAEPVAQSNLVTVVARDDTAEGAQRLASAFANEFVNDRTERLHRTLDNLIEPLRARVAQDPTGGTEASTASPASQLRALETLRDGDDPSVRVESEAELPAAPVSPRPAFTLAASLFSGLVLGLLGAFGMQLIDPRLRNEDQLRARFRLPILARIPLERRRLKRPLLPSELSLGALDGYQALRASLTAPRGDALSSNVVLVTGASPGDGKSTTAINLASVIAAAGKRVILIEADSRRPSVGRALDMEAQVGLASVVTGRNYLVEALMPVGTEESKLRVLLTKRDEAPAADVLSHLSADTLLLQARRLADWVVVDSPPLNHVAETLALAQTVDHVIVVVRLGATNTRELEELAEMLAHQNISPSGFVVLGGHVRKGYY